MIAYLTPKNMGPGWIVMSMDEVYVRDRITADQLIGLVVHAGDAEAVIREFLPHLRRLGIPVYSYNGSVVWPND